MERNRAFAERLIGLRNERGFSKSSFARAVDVTTTCVWNWEEGNTFPRSDALKRCASVLGTTTAYLERGVAPPRVGQEVVHPPHANSAETLPRTLEETIHAARRDIASIAGLSIEQVKVVLEYGA
jgi:transcriptional regulator with XRE-family HTH domain